MKLRTYLQLGRVSNLPTVWTNVAAGIAVAGGPLTRGTLLPALAAGSLMYVGGMFLNDAFDREIDRRERPERPIPSGRAGVGEVFGVGFGLLLAGWLLLLVPTAPGAGRASTLTAGAALAGAIVLYNAWHKGNPLGPVVMGICRALLYITAALYATATAPGPVLAVAAVALAYLVGLTYAAKQESLARVENAWPLVLLAVPLAYGLPLAARSATVAAYLVALAAWIAYCLHLLIRRRQIGRAVVGLIAGISLLDAMLIAAAGRTGAALLAVAAFGATLALQRVVRGT